MLADLTVKDFLDKVACSDPVPGGGSIAALDGALASALSTMVARLTVGKKGYEASEEGEHFHKNGLHIKTLKDTRHVFHLKKEISNYFFIFPSFTSSDSALCTNLVLIFNSLKKGKIRQRCHSRI